MQPVSMPPFWEKLLKSYVKKAFYGDTRKKVFADRSEFTEGDYRFFTTGVRELNLAFTQERASLPKNYLNRKELRSGYILYFLPINALKVAALLGEIPTGHFLTPEGLSPEGLQLTIMDVGSGPGTGMLGTMLYLERVLREAGSQVKKALQLRWILIDQNRQALNDAAALHDPALEQLRKKFQSWKISSEVRLVTGNFFSGRLPHIPNAGEGSPADLILCLNVTSELGRDRRLPLVEGLLRNHLAPHGRLLVMEPALRITTRDLMELRDGLLEDEAGFVYAPCLHQAACPMLRSNARDWCHTYIPWNQPPWMEKIDRLAAIRKDYLKCSYLLLGREKTAGISADHWRVVSGPLNSKGKSERLLCGEGALPELLRVMRLDRDASPANQDFDHLERGDIVKVSKTTRIVKETTMRKIS